VYKKGVDNGATDALSRAPAEQCAAISVCQPQWLDDVLQSYADDPVAQDVLALLADTSVTTPHYYSAQWPYSLQRSFIHWE
jgi:hypothetical protein